MIPGVVAALLLLCPEPAVSFDERRLSFYHTHTAEKLDVVYARGGEYVDSALDDIERFLSDFRTGDVRTIDPALLDLVYEIRESLGSNGTFEVISAYRSPQTNEMLRDRSSGVAKNSQHTVGKAIDIRLVQSGIHFVQQDEWRWIHAQDRKEQRHTGERRMPQVSNFVHVDTGRVRRW